MQNHMDEIIYTAIMFLLVVIAFSQMSCFKTDKAIEKPGVIAHFDHACVMKCPCDILPDGDSWSQVTVPK